jgi:hypothetical protein
MPDEDQIVKVALAGAAAFAAYKFLYEPYAIKQRLQAELVAQTQANLAKGMTLEDASTAAVSGACQAVAAFYKIPPSSSGGVCKGIGALATYTTKLTLKASLAAAKLAGRGAKAAVLGVGKGVKAGVVGVGKGVKFAAYTAPKKVITTGASVVKFASYTAPKKVITGGAKAVGKGVKSVAKSAAHGFGLWGIDEIGSDGRPRRTTGNPFADHARRRAAGGSPAGRKRRSLAGLPDAGPARRGGGRAAAGARFYTRHL